MIDPEAIRSFAGKTVVVVGDLMLDVYLSGEVRRISPEAPVPILELGSGQGDARPGGAANAALNVAALGGRPLLFGVVGQDEEGARLKALLQAAGVATGAGGGPGSGAIVDDGERPTTAKTRIVARSQQIVRLDRESEAPLSPAIEGRLGEAVLRALATADACIVSDYKKGVMGAGLCGQVIGRARALGRPVVVDPKGRHFARYRGASVVTPNTAELELAAGRAVDSDAGLASAAAQVIAELDGAALLVTRGAAGMTLFRGDRPPHHLPARARQVYDVTGAGDTVVAALALGLAAGLPLEGAMELANAAAGIAVSRPGTAAVAARDLLAALEGG